MAKIYFRRQATIPPQGTNGIAVFCTSNEKLYLDGILYGSGSEVIQHLTKETWWGGKTEIEIVDGSANIDLTDMARQVDVKRLLDDVFVIKNELELDGPLDPSGDPRSAIDILNGDITAVNKDLQSTKITVGENTYNIQKNYSAITNLGDIVNSVSSNTVTNAKNIAVDDKRIGKLESRERDLTYSAECLYTYGQENRNRIIFLEDSYISAITVNGTKKATVKNNVANIEIDESAISAQVSSITSAISSLSEGLSANSSAISSLSENYNSLSTEVMDFEDQVADDIENLYDALGIKLSGVSVDGVNAPVVSGVAQLHDVSLDINGDIVSITNLSGGVSSAKLPTDKYISAGTYDAKTGTLYFTLSNGSEISVSGISCQTQSNNVSVYSSNSSVTVTSSVTSGGTSFGLSILDDDLLNYLNGLKQYTYGFTASTPSTITIDLTKGTSGSTTVTLTSGRYRKLDEPTYTKDNQEPVSVVSSITTSTGWEKVSENKWKYTLNITDKTVHSYSKVSFVSDVTNADNVSGTTNTVNASIVVNKPFIIIEGQETPTSIDSYLNDLTTTNFYGVGNYTAKTEMSFDIQTATDYFFICAPSNKSISYTQNNASQVNSASTIDTIYGAYKIYKSKAPQKKATIKGVLTIQ